MKQLKFTILFLSAVIALASQSFGQTIKSFDKDKNDSLSLAELKAYILHSQIKTIATVDTSKNGKLDSWEILLQTEPFILDFINKFGVRNDTNYSNKEVKQLYPEPKKFKTGGILLRETLEDISPASPAKPISKIKAALFSYTHDFGAGTNTWVAKGAIMRPCKINDRFYIAPGITFNRLISEDATKAANSLIPKIGLYFRRNGSGIVVSHLIRVFGNYGTDFDFKSSQYGVEVEWEPVFKNGPFGVYWRLPDSDVELRLQAFLHAEAGYVKEKGEKENLKSDDTYLRAGGKLGVDIRFFEAVELSGGYRYLKGISGTPKDTPYFTGALAYSLGPNGNIALKIEYQKGNLPLTLEEVNNIVVGLGIKF